MSLRTPTEPSGQRTGQEAAEASLVPGLPMPEAVRSRIPISRVPQPREDRMISTWRLAKPRRIAAALKASQEQNPENALTIRGPTLASQDTQLWDAHRRHRQPYVGRGVRESWRCERQEYRFWKPP